MEGSQISFIIRATYDVLSRPNNLYQWVGEDPACPLCQTPATLRYITQVLPVEVECRFMATSIARLLKGVGVQGQAFRKAIRSLSEAAERSSRWIWIKRKEVSWVYQRNPGEGGCPPEDPDDVLTPRPT